VATPDLTAIGLISLGLGQLATIISVALSARNARLRESAASHDKADAIAAAAKLVDDRAMRERQWMLEDRDRLEKKVQSTADVLAAKVAADNAEVARVLREHTAELAAQARHDQVILGQKVDTATEAATTKVDDLTALIVGVGEDAKAAYHEANGAKLLIADTNKVLAEEVERRNIIDTKLSDGGTSRRSTDPHA